jgi:hypothetical protein
MRLLGFRSGLLVALIAPGVIALAVAGITVASSPGAPPHTRFTAMVRTDGAALSRRGGAKLILKDGYDTITLLCRGACDDLSVDSTESLYGGYDAKVLDIQGGCVACTWDSSPPRGDMIITSLAGGGLIKTVPKARD